MSKRIETIEDLEVFALQDFAHAVETTRLPDTATAYDVTRDAAARVMRDWNTRGIEFGWPVETRSKMTAWLADLLASTTAKAVRQAKIELQSRRAGN